MRVYWALAMQHLFNHRASTQMMFVFARTTEFRRAILTPRADDKWLRKNPFVYPFLLLLPMLQRMKSVVALVRQVECAEWLGACELSARVPAA